MTRLRSRGAAGALAILLVCCVEASGLRAGSPWPADAAPAPPLVTSQASTVADQSSSPVDSPSSAEQTVVIRLRGRADLAIPRGRSRRARLAVVRDRLRSTAEDAQAPLLDRLRGWRRQGRVSGIQPLWISNSIRVRTTRQLADQIARRSDVVSVTPDAIQIIPAAGPPATNQSAIGAPSVWAAGHTGRGVVVASLDSGVDVTHDDLASRWRGGTNSWFDPYDQHTAPTDLTGHGTGVLGVMVAGDGTGTSLGTAPAASWIAARVFDDSGASSVTAVHEAFQWLLDPDGDPATADAPRVVNASWSLGAGPGCDETFRPDVQALRAAGILTVFAAGNFGPTSGSSVSPANYPESVSVGAVSSSNLISSLSSRGPSTCAGRTRPFPDLVAPGVDILTTDRWGLLQYQSGTSVAAPHVAGTLALLLNAQPGMSADVQEQLVTESAADLGSAGVDESYGHGLVDAAAAYAALPALQPRFDLTVSPVSTTVEAGSSVSYSVNLAPVNGFDSDVSLSVEGLPTDVTASFSPEVVPGGSGSAALTVSAGSAASPGSAVLSVSASGGGVSEQTDVSLEVTAPPPTEELYLSTAGNVRPPGVTGTPDNADLYRWSGSDYSRVFDATVAGLPRGTAVDGYHRVDDTHFYLSFAPALTWVPGLGNVQDEDVVYYDDGVWSVFFDGTSRGLTSAAADVDAISISGSSLYFSTQGNVKPLGVSGRPDNADLYRWDGAGFARVWDATAHGVPASTNVDGLSWVDSTRFYLSFAPTTTAVPGLGTVDDEDVVGYDADVWSTYFDGTAHGLSGWLSRDVNAFDLP